MSRNLMYKVGDILVASRDNSYDIKKGIRYEVNYVTDAGFLAYSSPEKTHSIAVMWNNLDRLFSLRLLKSSLLDIFKEFLNKQHDIPLDIAVVGNSYLGNVKRGFNGFRYY